MRKIEMFIPNVKNVTVTLFNDARDEAEVLERRGNGSKKAEDRIHDDIAEVRVNKDAKGVRLIRVPHA